MNEDKDKSKKRQQNKVAYYCVIRSYQVKDLKSIENDKFRVVFSLDCPKQEQGFHCMQSYNDETIEYDYYEVGLQDRALREYIKLLREAGVEYVH
jgi:hypothetical protein|nr:MAG TPA: hypothetical protein [Caudoviricetes sp.]